MLDNKKWKDRKAQLDVLVKRAELAGPGGLAAGDYSDLEHTITTIIQDDTNVYVVSTAVAAAGLLARGLVARFAAHAKVCYVPVRTLHLILRSWSHIYYIRLQSVFNLHAKLCLLST